MRLGKGRVLYLGRGAVFGCRGKSVFGPDMIQRTDDEITVSVFGLREQGSDF